MTSRGRSVLALGVVVYVAAWAFGSKPLYPVAAGLLVVSALAWLWVRIGSRTFRLQRRTGDRDLFEGDDATIRLTLEPIGRVPLAAVEIVERIERLRLQRHALRRFGDALRIDYMLPDLRRGRYAYEEVRAELSDPFGLQRVSVALSIPGALLVYPRIVPLERLFSDAARHGLDGRRMVLRRPAGFDLHSVREHVEGESLRRVHWPSTARRARLMVRELEDSPRDEIAVVLDTNAVTGDSFDAQVRAAGSILAAHVERGRRVVLGVNAGGRNATRIHHDATDWRRALDALASVQPDTRASLVEFLRADMGVTLRALELTIVTSRVDAALVTHLLQRALARRRVSLVYVDAATFAGKEAQGLRELGRLNAAGISVALVRAGDDLRRCLEGEAVAELAHA